MNERQARLLRCISSALEFNPGTDKLVADEVNALGGRLGLTPQEVLHLVEELKMAHLVEVHWPGNVSITSKGRSALSPSKATSVHVNVGPGGMYFGNNARIGPGAVVGQEAMGPGAVRREGYPLDL